MVSKEEEHEHHPGEREPVKRRSPAGPPDLLHPTPPPATAYEKLSYPELLDEARRLYESLQLAWHLEVSYLDRPDWRNLEDLDVQLHQIEDLFEDVGAEL